tara:strand:+ start:1595 stop:2293 length:699 start_codon:yes stop_codon:yes gene_type:complete
MPEIDIIQNSAIPRIPNIYIPKQSSIPNRQHITRTLPPVFDMPCVTIRRDGTKNNQLFIDDPAGNVVINCPIPFYEPINYNKKDLVIIEKKQDPPTNVETPEPETVEPKIPDVKEEITPCPDPKKNNPRIGDLNSKGTEKVTGFKYIEETKECVVQWASTSATEKYLPSLNTVSTTFAITIVATTAATLTPWLTKLLKPLFKQFIGKFKKILGKKGTRFQGKKPIKTKLNNK